MRLVNETVQLVRDEGITPQHCAGTNGFQQNAVIIHLAVSFFVTIISDLNFILYLPNLIQLPRASDSSRAAVGILLLCCCLTSVV